MVKRNIFKKAFLGLKKIIRDFKGAIIVTLGLAGVLMMVNGFFDLFPKFSGILAIIVGFILVFLAGILGYGRRKD